MQNRKGFRPTARTQAPDANQMTFQRAQAFHKQGNLAEAQKLYADILLKDPNHFDALHFCGVIAYQKGDLGGAESFYVKAISLKNSAAAIYVNYGLLLHVSGRLDEAVASYDSAIQRQPNDAYAFNNRGVSLEGLKRFDDALASFDRAISIHSNFADAYINRGNLLKTVGRLPEALSSYDRSIEILPGDADAFNNRGVVLNGLRRFDEALASYERALSLKPNFAEAYCNRGKTLNALKRFDEALASYDKSIGIKSDYAEAHNNRGATLALMLRFPDALASYERALAIKPDYAEALNNCGVALQNLKMFDAALARYSKAIDIKPDYAEACWNKASLLLLFGKFGDGLTLYEWRKRGEDPKGERTFRQPLWLGEESLRNRRILIHEEQGVGDVVQFCRYIKLLEAEGAKVVFAVSAKLAPLMKRLGSDAEICLLSDIPDDFDFHCPLMSLPLAFKTDLATIPAMATYLFADEKRSHQLHQRLSRDGMKKVCGLSWYSKADRTGVTRSVDLLELFNHIDPTEYTFVSLQYGDVADQIADLKAKKGVEIVCVPEVDNFQDLDGFAALVDACDVVLTIDNTTVHLAGALNKKTLVMLPDVPDWRWMLDRDDSPWYPSIRLLRQELLGDWRAVFQRVGAALAEPLGQPV